MASPEAVAGRFSAGEVATLAALAETFVPGVDAPRIAGLAAEALCRAADPSQIGQLKLVLHVLENPLVNAASIGRARGISGLPPSVRERLLLQWAHSALALQRSGFQAFRKLLSFLAYAAVEPGVASPLDRVGYVADSPPVTADRTPVRPLAVDRRPGGAPVTLEADVIVVGAGAGGGVVAAELARAGRSVLVLDAGPFVDEASMPRTELEAFSRLYLNHGLLSTWDASISILAGSGVGGGTLVNWMTCIDIPARVRAEWARDHGLDGLDGPEWEADRSAIETEIGVAPSQLAPPKDAAILAGAASLGWEAAPIQRNAVGCDDCGSCPFGCVRGAKRSGIRAHLATAAAHGARIVDRIRVTRLLIDAGRVVGLEGNLLVESPADGMPVLAAPGDPTSAASRPFVARAPQVVLAAGALRSPAILQATGKPHAAVGRHLRLHPVPVVAARFREPVDMWRGIMQAARSAEFLDDRPEHRGYVIESAPGHPGLLALALPWDGAADHAAWMAGSRHLAPFIAVTRDGGDGRVSLTRAGRVRIDYLLDGEGVRTLRHALQAMARLARAAGATEVLAAATPIVRHRVDEPGGDRDTFERFLDQLGRMDFGANRGSVFSAHQMGTIRAGGDATDHAADPRGRVRDPEGRRIGGLYVADTSTFPTGLGVNPMLAVMSMARRISRTILAEAAVPG